MSKLNKVVERFLTIPKDFTWDELIKVLRHYGYEEMKAGKTGGSRRRLIDAQKNVITLHKPHPGNVVKTYALINIVVNLKEKGKIKDE